MPWIIHLSATLEVIKKRIGPFPVNQLQYFWVGGTYLHHSLLLAYILPDEPGSKSHGAVEGKILNGTDQRQESMS